VLAVVLSIRPFSANELNVVCGSGLSFDLPATVQVIKTTDCLETEGSEDGNEVTVAIVDMNSVYHVNDPISFTIHTIGESVHLCNDPKVNVGISSIGDGSTVWSTPITLQTALLCGDFQNIDKEWRFGYEGEELPYQSALVPSPYQENSIAIDQPGSYRIIAEFDNHKAEKEFQIVS
jgi:hypothetical protein